MLQQLRLENFKGLKKAEIDFGRITVLIGPNGTGKSSILQALMVLRQSRQSSNLEVNGSLINLGNFEDILDKGALKKQIGFGCSAGVAEYPTIGIPQGASFSCDGYFTPDLVSLNVNVGIDQEKYISVKTERKGTAAVEPKMLIPKGFSLEELRAVVQPIWTFTTPLSIREIAGSQKNADAGKVFAEEIKELLSELDKVLNKVHYVPAIRGLELPDYLLSAKASNDFTPGQNTELASTFAYAGSDIKEMVSTWSEDITGSPISPKLIPGKRVRIQSDVVPGGIPVIGNGFGTNQLAQVLLMLAITPKYSLLAIEEPEIHLHPKAQPKLCDILLQNVKTRDKQLVISTHSQYILYSFIQAVKNGKLTQDELSIYYFEEKGEKPRRVEQDECGDIYETVKNFFYEPDS